MATATTQSTQSNQSTQTSDINDLSKFRNVPVSLGINYEKSSTDAPPPIPEGDYLVKFELGDADLDKAVAIGQSAKYNGGNPFLKLKLKLNVLESLNEAVPTSAVFNRSMFENINSGVMNRGDASRVSDFCRCAGINVDHIPTNGTLPELQEWFVEQFEGGLTGKIHIGWKASGKSEVETDPNKQWLKPKQFDGMDKWPTDPDGNVIPVIHGYYHKATDETLDLKAVNVVTDFYPAA